VAASINADVSAYGTRKPNAMQRAVIAVAQATPLKRGTFRPMLSKLVNLFGRGPVDTTYQGASFRFYHQASATERGALFNADYNGEELAFLRTHTPQGGVFIDVGANVGTFALPMACHVGPAGRVVAIEPHPLSHARLAFNAQASQFSHVALVAVAAGDQDGELLLATDDQNLGASAISREAGLRVPARQLYSILQEQGVAAIDALKIDVEGYEDRVLMPFFRDAPASLWPKAVVIEHLEANEWLDNCLDEMMSRGYQVAGKTRSNTLLLL
jgi:FkbM family methyltransferase